MVNPNDKSIIPPEDMIDHNNANFSQIENIMTIFVAYNQANIQQGTPWDNWPDWELCLTEINSDVHFELEDDSDEVRAQREHWLAVMQFIHDSEDITADGYAITVNGSHGHTFSFDICFDNELWLCLGEMDKHVEKILDKYGTRFITRPNPYIMPSGVNHSLGPMWICPEYVPKYGGQDTHFTGDYFCLMKGDGDSFPTALHSLLNLCIDDTEIWAIAYIDDLKSQGRAEWMDENWPGGIPDQDWEYQ